MSPKAEVFLLLLRCEYISTGLYKSPLTEKGKGDLPTSYWVEYNKQKCNTDPEHRRMVGEILGTLNDQQKINNN